MADMNPILQKMLEDAIKEDAESHEKQMVNLRNIGAYQLDVMRRYPGLPEDMRTLELPNSLKYEEEKDKTGGVTDSETDTTPPS